MEQHNHEVMSAITSDIQGFLLDMGAEAGSYEYDHAVRGGKAYTVEIRVLGEEASELAEERAENIYELQEHLRITYPEVRVVMTLTTVDDEYLVEEEEELEDLIAEICESVDSDEDAAATDNAERQYEEEGLRIIDEDDETIDFVEELGDDDDDDFEDEVPRRRRSRASEDDGFYEEEEEEEYIPSEEDREELWKMFGGADDE